MEPKKDKFSKRHEDLLAVICCMTPTLYVTGLYIYALTTSHKNEIWALVVMIIHWIVITCILVVIIKERKPKNPSIPVKSEIPIDPLCEILNPAIYAQLMMEIIPIWNSKFPAKLEELEQIKSFEERKRGFFEFLEGCAKGIFPEGVTAEDFVGYYDIYTKEMEDYEEKHPEFKALMKKFGDDAWALLKLVH